MDRSGANESEEAAWRMRNPYHEAGHAVVAILLEIPFEHVKCDGVRGGEVKLFHSPMSEDQLPEIAKYQKYYAAGAAAEKLFWNDYKELGAQRDRQLHQMMEEKRHPRRSDGWERDIEAAMKLLEPERESVQKLADAPQWQRTTILSMEEVYAILGRPLPWDEE